MINVLVLYKRVGVIFFQLQPILLRMKLLVVFLGFFCLASAKPLTKADHTLEDSIKDFLKIVNFDEILPIVLEGMSENDEVIEALDFMQGPEFTRIVQATQLYPQFRHTLAILYDLGLDVYFYLNALADVMGWPEIEVYRNNLSRKSSTILEFLDELKGVLPLDELNKIYEDKMKNDEVFQKAMAQIKSKEFNEVGDMIREMDEWDIMIKRLQEKGIDTDAVMKAILDFFGWH